MYYIPGVPWVISPSNYEKVAKSHLKAPERIEVVEGAVRGVVALTDRRLLVSNFPWVGSASLLFEAPLAGLSRVAVTRKGHACELVATAGGFARRVVLPGQYKVIFMSGYADDAILRHGVSSSELAFVEKPLLPDVLLAKVREVLDGFE